VYLHCSKCNILSVTVRYPPDTYRPHRNPNHTLSGIAERIINVLFLIQNVYLSARNFLCAGAHDEAAWYYFRVTLTPLQSYTSFPSLPLLYHPSPDTHMHPHFQFHTDLGSKGIDFSTCRL